MCHEASYTHKTTIIIKLVCDASLTDAAVVTSFESYYDTKKTFPCPTCNTVCHYRRDKITLYTAGKESMEKYDCQKCNLSFSIVKTSIPRGTELKFQCPFSGCVYQTTRKWNLKSHVLHVHKVHLFGK